MKKIITGITLLVLCINIYGQPFKADIKFYIQNLGATVEGTLEGFDSEINFDAEDPGSSSIKASVDVSTIKTGINMRDNHLQSKKFFNTEEYPEITMVANKIVKKEEGNFLGYFDLTIKGTTKVVEVPFRYSKSTDIEIFSGRFMINRRDFDIGGALVPSGDEVEVSLNVERSGIS